MVGKKSRVRTYNFGIAGGYSSDGLAVYPRVAALRPKVVLLEFLMNDCLLVYNTSRANMVSMISGIKAASPASAIYLMTMNPTRGSSSSATQRSALPTFNAIYRELAPLMSVGIIDTYDGWSAATLSDIPDGVHPTDVANRTYLVPRIAEVLAPLIT